MARLEQEFALAHGLGDVVALRGEANPFGLLLRGLGVGRGDEVIVPALAGATPARAAAALGATPVVADVDQDSLLVTVETVEAVRSPRTRAVVVAHLFGHVVAPADALGCAELGLVVVEDATHAHLAHRDGVGVGHLGHAAVFGLQFGPDGAASGPGALLAFGDAAAGGAVRKASPLLGGRPPSAAFGEEEVAVLCASLATLPARNDDRRRIAQRVADAAGPAGIRLVAWHDGDVHHRLAVRVDPRHRQRVIAMLAASGIASDAPLDARSLASSRRSDLRPNARRAEGELLTVPLDGSWGSEQVDGLCAALAAGVGVGVAGGPSRRRRVAHPPRGREGVRRVAPVDGHPTHGPALVADRPRPEDAARPDRRSNAAVAAGALGSGAERTVSSAVVGAPVAPSPAVVDRGQPPARDGSRRVARASALAAPLAAALAVTVAIVAPTLRDADIAVVDAGATSGVVSVPVAAPAAPSTVSTSARGTALDRGAIEPVQVALSASAAAAVVSSTSVGARDDAPTATASRPAGPLSSPSSSPAPAGEVGGSPAPAPPASDVRPAPTSPPIVATAPPPPAPPAAPAPAPAPAPGVGGPRPTVPAAPAPPEAPAPGGVPSPPPPPAAPAPGSASGNPNAGPGNNSGRGNSGPGPDRGAAGNPNAGPGNGAGHGRGNGGRGIDPRSPAETTETETPTAPTVP